VISEDLSRLKVSYSRLIETQKPSLSPSPDLDSLPFFFPWIDALVAKRPTIDHDIAANLLLTSKSHLTFDRIDAPPHVIELLFGYRRTKLALKFGQCNQQVTRSANFAIVRSGK
jgi:hypothetical protein